MAAGETTTQSLADSLPTLIQSARIVREYAGVMPTVVDKVTLGKGQGLSWNEVSLAQLTAQAVTETTHLNNPQQLSDTVFTITPTSVGIQTLITDRTANRISQNAFRKTGVLAMNAIQRKKDEDGLTVLDGMTSLGGAGTTLTSGHISAATSTITSNTTEGALGPIFGVLHGFQIKDLQDEIVQGVNPSTAPEQLLTTGLAARTYQSRFRGMLFGAMLLEDGNISIDSADDSKGGVFAKEAVVLVQGHSPRTEVRREPHIAGGATSVFIYDEYAYGERSTGNWGREIYSDATAPTS